MSQEKSKMPVSRQMCIKQVLEAEQVKQTWNNHNANCKAKLLSIPAKLALELS